MLSPAAVLILVIVTLLLCLSFQPTLSNVISEIAKPFHEACRLASPQSRHAELYQAIVCGVQLGQSPFKEALKTSGLIHLLVVSGSHLVFLTHLIEPIIERVTHSRSALLPRLRSPAVFLVISLGLLAFALACRFQPPIARAWFYLLLAKSNLTWRLRWTALQRITASSLLALCFCGSSNDLHSLLLSWTASLAIYFRTVPVKHTSPSPLIDFKHESKTYLLLLPALWSLGAPHPMSIAAQVAVAPLLSYALFPFSILAMIVPVLTPAVDFLWSTIIWLCMEIARHLPAGWPRIPLGLSFLWTYVFSLTVALEWMRRSKGNCR